MRMSVSILTPKAFSKRSAISPDRSALPLSRLDRAGRETWSTLAAAVTDRPCGSMISVRMKSPGWGGFNIRMAAVSLSFLMVILKIHVAYLALGGVYTKGQPPVARDVQAPCAFAIAGQQVRLLDRSS